MTTAKPDVRSRVLIVTIDELAVGYRLAGADVLVVADAGAAGAKLIELLNAGEEVGVIAVHEPYFTALDPPLLRRLERTLPPLVVALPAGELLQGDSGRRERLLQRLWQAVGYEITFDSEGPK
ncbi:V-type ATP synthase subunit F [Arthrobacter sp. CG_A4]|uniref:V-type ATP synthase subunit F n=1 Tax=Arthrobacter sp. CG_A4 TaxID=3071706 RepID=UPI002DFF8C7D|nr:vacuolar-type H+-ATPase subunit F/Vma7 [Arthrobacter sp. CG_A4]